MTLNHAFPAFFSAIVFICLAGPTTPKVSADVIIDATADGFITDEGIVDDDDNFVRARLGGGGFENRGIIEFDLSTLAGGVTIESVEFRGYSSLVTTGTVVEVYGYNGTSPIAIETETTIPREP